jgi:peptidoglycan hydrolase-like protein with peptidoglycan-binding domain
MRKADVYLGRPVYSLQTMLRQISMMDNRVLPVVPDGRYGRSTTASVRSFQKARGLPQTGRVDPATWKAISRVFDAAKSEQTAPVTQPLWKPGTAIRPGQCNLHLHLVQGLLAGLSKLYPAIPTPQTTGCLDPSTEAGLRWIQMVSGLPQTGELNTATWHALNGLYRVAAGEG